MLDLLTTGEFARWFGSLDDALAEDVAAAIDVIEQLGPERAAPGSRESLLWYEHPAAARVDAENPLAQALEAWGAFRDYARQLLTKLESPRFASRLERLPPSQAATALEAVRQIRAAVDPRSRWTLELHRVRAGGRSSIPGGPDAGGVAGGPDDAREQLRRAYLAAIEAAGFLVADVPAHSLALRELARRAPGKPFRLLYGVNAEKETALVVLGERLDRTFYGDSVRRAEAAWGRFLSGGLRAAQRMPLR